ncbi:hypothetical protein V8G54_001571 [Vigna mungo]|uniref:Uncharacterized protein n=1 Tax=Vigna mungo TaxID=3915 RepID=A0AAQ3SA15_VIGMU
MKFCVKSCVEVKGTYLNTSVAMRSEMTLPKLAITDILTYFIVLPKVSLPCSTPATSTFRSFSSKIISAMSFAMATPESTEMLTFAASKASESFTPSPKNPTTWFPTVCKDCTTWSF